MWFRLCGSSFSWSEWRGSATSALMFRDFVVERILSALMFGDFVVERILSALMFRDFV